MFKFAVKELSRKWKWSLLFCFNLSLGFIGFICILSFKDAIRSNLTKNSRQILSADISISARKMIPLNYVEAAEKMFQEMNIKDFKKSKIIEFYAMIKVKEKSQLILVKAIDDSYPLYGKIKLYDHEAPASTTSLSNLPSTWIYEELKNLLNLEVNDTIDLGKVTFAVSGIIEKDDTQTMKFGTLAPKIFIHQKWLQDSELIQTGSTFSETYFYRLPFNADVDAIQSKILEKIDDPAVQIETYNTAAENSNRQMTFFTDFLSLVSIIAIILSSLGSFFLYQLFIRKKTKEYAILKSIGLVSSRILSIFLWQNFVLSTLILLLTSLSFEFFKPVLSYFLKYFFSIDIAIEVSVQTLILSYLLINLVSASITFIYFRALEKVKVNYLFNEESFNTILKFSPLPIFISSIAILILISFFLTRSFVLTSAFIGSLIFTGVILFLFFQLMLNTLKKLKLQNWVTKYSLKSIHRRKNSSLVIFLCIGIATLMLNLLPHFKNSIKKEFDFNPLESRPSLFLFDIQEDQLNDLESQLDKKNYKLSFVSAFIRSRIITVNGVAFERKNINNSFSSREKESEARYRNRGVNLTIRSHLSDSEFLIEGVSLDKYKGSLPGISLEVKYAEKMGIHLNDIIEFDIQGVQLKAQVINFRKVRWSSFQPNFFVSFPEGVIDDAPKTYIAAIKSINNDQLVKVITDLNDAFPNISIIDVRKTLLDILKLADQLSLSLELMSYLTLLTGFVVLFSIIYIQVGERKWEINFLKILGASANQLKIYVLTEFNLLVFIASIVGVTISYILAFFIIHYFFETEFYPNYLSSFTIMAIVLIVSTFIEILASRQVFKQKPNSLLR